MLLFGKKAHSDRFLRALFIVSFQPHQVSPPSFSTQAQHHSSVSDLLQTYSMMIHSLVCAVAGSWVFGYFRERLPYECSKFGPEQKLQLSIDVGLPIG